MWNLLGPGIEPTSPALEGGFFTTAPSEALSVCSSTLHHQMEHKVSQRSGLWTKKKHLTVSAVWNFKATDLFDNFINQSVCVCVCVCVC